MLKNGIINSVEGRRKIKKTETSDLLLTQGSGNMVTGHVQQVKWFQIELNLVYIHVSRLEGVQEIVFIAMASESGFNKSFCEIEKVR